jgi:hypothetical protein
LIIYTCLAAFTHFTVTFYIRILQEVGVLLHFTQFTVTFYTFYIRILQEVGVSTALSQDRDENGNPLFR